MAWNGLPDEFKTGDIVDYVVCKLVFVRDGLTGPAKGAARRVGRVFSLVTG
ncbi:MAG: hypothetical protein KDJ88_07430 [Bauldia sp.]|nr:hypothetical protein [Bauldia sp.]